MKKFGKKSLELKDFEIAKIEACKVKGCRNTSTCVKSDHCGIYMDIESYHGPGHICS